jgi:DNA-directed RNA polymerase beta subunit
LSNACTLVFLLGPLEELQWCAPAGQSRRLEANSLWLAALWAAPCFFMHNKYFSRYKKPLVNLPSLVELQKNSFAWLVEHGLGEIFKEFSPIKDYTEKKFDLEFTGFELGKPKYDEHYAKANNLSYDVPLRVTVKLYNKTTREEKEQEIFLADFPIMTQHGTFVINGVERVIVPQLARSFGVFFTSNDIKGRKYFGAKVIPVRGVWIELESEADGAIYTRIDRKRKFTVNHLLNVLAKGSHEAVQNAYKKAGAQMPADVKAFFSKDGGKTL